MYQNGFHVSFQQTAYMESADIGVLPASVRVTGIVGLNKEA